MESASAMSTYCRSCGQHFRIVRQEAPRRGFSSLFRKAAPAPPSQGVSRQPSIPLQISGVGEDQAEVRAQSALGPSSRERPAGETYTMRDVVCFECKHHHRVSASATSSLCPSCGTYIDLRNVEIKERSTQRIRTRGDVIIHKKGASLGTSIQCGNLTVHGQVSGSIYASGDVIFKGDGKVLGEIRCRRFVVEKKVELQCLQPVYADIIEINGPTLGRFFAAESILVGRHGCIDGTITGRTLTVEAGAIINGPVNVAGRRERKPAAPDKAAGAEGLPAGAVAG